jgi:glycerol uptake facilitator-like aquaporin
MRIEIVIFLITAFLIANVYTEGKFLKKLFTYKKYYQMAGIAFGGIIAWWLFKKNPQKANEMFATSHEYLKYLPIDQNTSNVISPILDFT